MFKHILHPNSLSAADACGFDHALALAVRLKSKLTIMHVREHAQSGHDWRRFPGVRKRLTDWRYLPEGTARSDVHRKLGIGITKIDADHDNPVESIVNFLQVEDADLIVLSNAGRQGFRRWTSPSVSEPVARKSRVPCMFVPAGCERYVDSATGTIDITRILVPVADRPNPAAAESVAKEFVDALGIEDVEISYLHVGNALDNPPHAMNIQYATGKVPEVICSMASAVDLIVMTTEGHTSIIDDLLGSTTEQVIRRAPCPVLTVPTY